ncbi:hypothetical protein ACEWY4_015759 [Coilia grayii]|uniref:Uncharacterized protein n=1 Tax=Coilia grayii TaxID=363190 RepID=A0ABD1JPX7_9TELE
MKFVRLFGRVKSAVIGMIHVRALPGTPLSTAPLSEITEEACREVEIYQSAGLDGLIIENMHDIPYTFEVGPEICASMTAICAEVRHLCPSMPLGVQVLSAANESALAIALASGLDFIRAEGYVFSHVADEGLLNACAGNLLRYRKKIGADHIQIFTDIKKKHSSHSITADVSIVETAKAAEFFLSDGLIVTGTATGAEADPAELREVAQAVSIPVLIGSGVTQGNVQHYLDANAMIIGSHFKRGGYWANALDPERVKRFMEKVDELRK